MAENNQDKEIKDTKAIEEKALNYLKSFIEDSRVISQFIDDNDKEPCWDGHLYLYGNCSVKSVIADSKIICNFAARLQASSV